MHIELSQAHYQELLRQTQSAYPLEACGLMAGRDNRVRRLYPVTNIRQSPYEYEMDPVGQLDAMIDLEQNGWDLIAIYHSHPQGPQMPSASDVAQAYYPEAGHVIVSLLDYRQPRARAFTIISGQVTEIPLRLV
jgi:proteasome lid subunit RPN8/RPN11